MKFEEGERFAKLTFEDVVLGADGGIGADVADHAAADLPRPRLGRRGRRQQEGEEAEVEEQQPPVRERTRRRRHGFGDSVGRASLSTWWGGFGSTVTARRGQIGRAHV